MKKILSSLLLLSLLFALNVKADAGPPALPELEMEVLNSNGAKCYNFNWEGEKKVIIETGKVYQYGTKLVGSESSAINGNSKDYYEIYDDDNTEQSCYIKASDLTVKQETYDLSKALKQTVELKILVGVKIYSGPSTSFYKELGQVPKDVDLKSEYMAGQFWYYIEYNGIKGWICSDSGYVVHKYEEPIEFINFRPLSIFDTNNKTIGTIPVNTKLSVSWVNDAEVTDEKYYVTYNGVTGFINAYGSFSYDCKGTKIKVVKAVKVYEYGYEYNNSRGKELGSLETNKDYDVTYCAYEKDASIYYVNEKQGWVKEEDSDPFIIETSSDGQVFDHTKTGEDRVLLESIEIKGHEINFSKEQKEYTIELNEGETKLEYVVTPVNVRVQELNNSNLTEGSKVILRITDSEGSTSYTFIIKEKAKVEQPEPDPEPKNDGLSNEELIMICVGAGIVIAITILVTIILVNKKKKREMM